jgi:hypothetical protein
MVVSGLGELLYPSTAHPRAPLATLVWWEARRLKFNLIVGGTGVFTLLTVCLVGLIPPGIPIHPDWHPIVAYGLLANLCYSFGFPLELVLRKLLGHGAPPVGPALFRQGLAFAVGLTLLPIVLISVAWVVRLIGLFL